MKGCEKAKANTRTIAASLQDYKRLLRRHKYWNRERSGEKRLWNEREGKLIYCLHSCLFISMASLGTIDLFTVQFQKAYVL
jgi:hypothetical protein